MTELDNKKIVTIYKYKILGTRIEMRELKAEKKSSHYRVLCHASTGRETTKWKLDKDKEGVISQTPLSFYLTKRDDELAKKIAIKHLERFCEYEERIVRRKRERIESIRENNISYYDDAKHRYGGLKS